MYPTHFRPKKKVAAPYRKHPKTQRETEEKKLARKYFLPKAMRKVGANGHACAGVHGNIALRTSVNVSELVCFARSILEYYYVESVHHTL